MQDRHFLHLLSILCQKILFASRQETQWFTVLSSAALLWVLTQRRMVISYRRFGITYYSHIKWLRPSEDWTSMFSPKRRQEPTQKSADISYTTVRAWNQEQFLPVPDSVMTNAVQLRAWHTINRAWLTWESNSDSLHAGSSFCVLGWCNWSPFLT